MGKPEFFDWLPAEEIGPEPAHVDAPSAAYDGSELTIQSLFRARAKVICPAVSIVAIPNGTHIASLAGRAKANREGRTAGFPDVMCFWKGKGIAFIEFKTRKGRPSEAQSDWMARLTKQGFHTALCRHPDTALAFLRRCGAPFIDREGL